MNITPLINFTKSLKDKISIDNNIFLKLESNNLSGSIKDRIVNFILRDGINKKLIDKDTIIICSSSGNTGISVSMFCALNNYKCLILTNKKCSFEKKKIMESYGAELKVIEKDYEKYESIISKNYEKCFLVNQYENNLNPQAYIDILGPELHNQLSNIDYIISTASTGGTITGLAYYFKKILKSDTKIILADPYGSNLSNIILGSEMKDPYKSIIEGAGKNIKTSILDTDLIDNVLKISDEEAIDMCKSVAKKGYLLGGSSGLNIACALAAIKTYKISDKNIVVICPDAGYRYLSKIY